mgnify:CR=1 FL=1
MSFRYNDEMIDKRYNFNKYDDMLPFLGTGNNDIRGRLVLSTIYHNWLETGFEDISIPTEKKDNIIVVNENTVLGQCNNEYHAFIAKVNQQFNIDINLCLTTVKNLGFDYGDKDRLLMEFKRLFIQKIARIQINKNITNAERENELLDITDDVTKWRQANDISINKDKLLKILTDQKKLTEIQVKESMVNNIDFNCNPDFILQRLYEKHTNDAEKILKTEPVQIQNYDGQKVARYNLNDKNFNKLVNKDGEFVGYQSQYYFSLHANDRCFKTGVGKNCTDYMKKCLLGKEMTSCINFFKNDEFAKNLEMDLENTNVLMALDTLEALKFKFLKKYDFQYPQSVKSWNDNLDSNLYDEFVERNKRTPTDLEAKQIVEDAKKIRDNENVQLYIKGMHSIVSDNPALKNKIPDNQSYSNATAFNIKPKKAIDSFESYEARLYRLANEMKIRATNFSTMSGGNGIKQHLNSNYNNTRWLNIDDVAVKYNHWLTPEIKILEKIANNKMKKSKQKILYEDLKIMKKDLRELRDVEKKFYKSQKFKNNYATMLKIFGDKYPNKLNLETMNKWLNTRDKYAKKMNLRQQKVLNTYINLFKQIK